MQTASLVLGIIAIAGMFFGLIPCLGWFNIFVIPIALVGLIISIVAIAQDDKKPKGNSIAGIILCGMAFVISIIRWIIGGGIF